MFTQDKKINKNISRDSSLTDLVKKYQDVSDKLNSFLIINNESRLILNELNHNTFNELIENIKNP